VPRANTSSQAPQAAYYVLLSALGLVLI
jgi:hypothetical protein